MYSKLLRCCLRGGCQLQTPPFYRHEGHCPGCLNNCIKFFAADDDQTYHPRAGVIHQEITGTLGPNLGTADLKTIFQANILCNELDFDPTSLDFTLSMAMECVEEGILTEEAIGLPLRFGQAEAVITMIKMIAQREGFGDVLADGARRAAAQLGRQAERYALHFKGLELAIILTNSTTNDRKLPRLRSPQIKNPTGFRQGNLGHKTAVLK